MQKDGYIRISPEVYMRVVPNRKASEKHYRRIDAVAPQTGVVRLLRLTEKNMQISIWLQEKLIIRKKQSE